MEKIKIGISTCLLGEPVRYDGGHKRDRYLTDTLGRYFTYVPVCPEVECGLGVPRESMRLVGNPDNPRLMTRVTKQDHTERMLRWAERRVRELADEGLCGFIFKSDSPSSGLFRVRLYNEKGMPAGHSVGLWARAFTTAFPRLPVEEEGRLHDPDLRENFIERVFALKRFRDEVGSNPTASSLMAFHARNKLLLMAHEPRAVAELGRIASAASRGQARDAVARYEARFLEALAVLATVRRHVNTLQHMLGYFRDVLDDGDRRELLETIEAYGRELLPLVVPITLFRHHLRRHPIPWLSNQTYLDPHPIELKLRNHA